MMTLLWLPLAAASLAAEGQIAFLAGAPPEGPVVYVADAAAHEAVPVSGPGAGPPVWSPDGRWLAFHQTTDDGASVRVVRADGSDGQTRDHALPSNRRPRWSAEGARLAYEARRADGISFAAVYNRETGAEQLWAEGRPGLYAPVWLPTAKLMLAIDPERDLDPEGVDMEVLRSEAALTEEALRQETVPRALLAVGLATHGGRRSTELFLVTKTQALALLPLVPNVIAPERFEEWAPVVDEDGEQIAYESNDGGDREIFVLSRRGSVDVSNHRAADWNPVWGPGGEWLAFESFRGGRRGVYRVLADTARVYPVGTAAGYQSWAPAWAPEGDRLAFVSDRNGTPDVYVHTIGEEDPALLLQEAAGVPKPRFAPAWRPEGGG